MFRQSRAKVSAGFTNIIAVAAFVLVYCSLSVLQFVFVLDIETIENVFRVCMACYKHERVSEEFGTVMQTTDEVEGLLNCQKFSQPLSCLYQVM